MDNHGKHDFKVRGTEKKADEAIKWVTIHLRNSHIHLYKLAAVGLLLSTSTADCERGFSTMKKVKAENRSRLKSAVLNALMMVSNEGQTLRQWTSEAWRMPGTRLYNIRRNQRAPGSNPAPRSRWDVEMKGIEDIPDEVVVFNHNGFLDYIHERIPRTPTIYQ
ncbi:hypothetical protein DPMN_146126 [Dreissena polymorpha]|uniref:HAT C-terminal dimerisation domain-containing protein n=1 Tax=Dreissena polymorpha TaxID=45954 RepID=A0A9D4F7B2_DREPO|nr:hypothetical protein DPMN_146126 [Dreissena polymorpha]